MLFYLSKRKLLTADLLFLWELYSFICKENMLENTARKYIKSPRIFSKRDRKRYKDKEGDNKTLESIAIKYTLKTVGR